MSNALWHCVKSKKNDFTYGKVLWYIYQPGHIINVSSLAVWLVLDCNYTYISPPCRLVFCPVQKRNSVKHFCLQYFPFFFLCFPFKTDNVTEPQQVITKLNQEETLSFSPSFSASPPISSWAVLPPSWLPDTMCFQLQGQLGAPSVATPTPWSIYPSD